MKFIHWLLALLFLSFAVVQYNDPDPWLWIAIYLCMVVLAVLAARGKYYPTVMWVLVAGYTLYAVLLAPGMYDWYTSPDRSLLFDDLAKMQYYYIEEAREFLGLVICLITLAAYLYLARKQTPAS